MLVPVVVASNRSINFVMVHATGIGAPNWGPLRVWMESPFNVVQNGVRLAGFTIPAIKTVPKKFVAVTLLALMLLTEKFPEASRLTIVLGVWALVALMANIFMTIYGKVGLKELARQNLAKTAYAAQQFGKHATVLFTAVPRFNEFVVRTSEDPHAINSRLLGHKIVGGFPLNKFYPELGNASLWCCTEMTTRSMIDTAAGLVAQSQRSDATASDEASMEEVAK